MAAADRGPHRFDAVLGDPVEARVGDLGDQAMTAQFGDQAAGSVRTPLDLCGVFGRKRVKLALEIAVAEAIDGELAGQQRCEQRDVFRSNRVESGDVPTGLAL